MKFDQGKFVSNFIKNQFPLFYQEEGPDFILFVKAYYEWLESENQPIYQARRLFDYRDIDNTLEEFLEYFQKKYLYGIPFNVIANKRFLLKHILDVYRSKGAIQCYRLLFKLLYNEDIEIYLPGKDVLRISDGTWVEPKYLEVTVNDDLEKYVGKTIVGATSGVTATVENFVKENYNNDIINVLYISNILPKKREFVINEKIVLLEDAANTTAINLAPTLLGSLDKIRVVNGGQDYNIGDVIKIVQRDLTNNDVISYGVDGVLKVTKLFTGFGSLEFDILDGGFGYTNNALTFVYRTTANGQGAGFSVESLTSQQSVQYNTDLICDYANLQLDATAYGFPKEPTANLTYGSIGFTLSYKTEVFGTIFGLGDVTIGNSYESSANVFVRSVVNSKPLPGTITYNTLSNTVTGVSTIFDTLFQNNDVIALQSNSSNSSTLEYAVVKNVVSPTQITLYGPPTKNSTATAEYRYAATILPAQFARYEPIMYTPDASLAGENEIVLGFPNTGNNIVLEAEAINSGKGYVEGEQIRAFLHSSVSNVVTISGAGTGYSANDRLLFVGGNPAFIANGFVQNVDSNGSITSLTIVSGGSGYKEVPEIRVSSNTGIGARLVASLLEFDSTSSVAEKTIRARVIKGPIGRGTGYYSTTRGFLDADKYIHDNYYYQDYSYEIRVAQVLNKYKDIINQTFHSAGSELFGKYLQFLSERSIANLTFDELQVFPTTWSVDSGNTILFLTSSTTTVDATETPINITANSSGFSSATDTLVVPLANSKFEVGDLLYYSVPSGNTPISPLSGNSYYYVSFANSSRIAVSSTLGGANVNINDTRGAVVGEIHTIAYVYTTDLTELDYFGYLSADNRTVTVDDRKIVSYLYASETKFRADENRIIVNRYYV